MSIRVAIVEDEASVRENLARLVDAAPGFRCVGKSATAEEALRTFPNQFPDGRSWTSTCPASPASSACAN